LGRREPVLSQNPTCLAVSPSTKSGARLGYENDHQYLFVVSEVVSETSSKQNIVIWEIRDVPNMTQTNAIILRFREEEAGNFEALFKKEVLPLWRQFKARGKIIAASLTPVQDGNRGRKGVRDYILHVEVPGMAEHSEFDSNASFLKFLPRAQAMQPEEPLVWLGNTLFQV